MSGTLPYDNTNNDVQRPGTPLAERMRPRALDEFVGQEDAVGEDSVLRRMIREDRVNSIILWGPPGSGKTTIAKLIAENTSARFVSFSAVTSGVKEVRRIIEEAGALRAQDGCKTILFVDELHRFNKSQQDAFLPAVEDGTVVLVGATTENPSFEVNTPLLSRCRVVIFKPLDSENILEILHRAINDSERGLAGLMPVVLKDELEHIAEFCDGDARVALNLLETAVLTAEPDEDGYRTVTAEHLQNTSGRKFVAYDKAGEEHFNTISAFIKSMRNSDSDAALYWMGRMLESGEAPLYVARRIVRFASEDIGMADPRAMQIAVAAQQAVHFIGMPEGELSLAEAAVYMATAPKSNALYMAYKAVKSDIQSTRDEPVPLQLRNAPTRLMKKAGYGSGYEYAHEYPEAVADLQCLPDRLKKRTYYSPTSRGFERTIRERLEFLEKLRKQVRENRKKSAQTERKQK